MKTHMYSYIHVSQISVFGCKGRLNIYLLSTVIFSPLFNSSGVKGKDQCGLIFL